MSWLRRLWCRVRGHSLGYIGVPEFPAGPDARPGQMIPARITWRCFTCDPWIQGEELWRVG